MPEMHKSSKSLLFYVCNLNIPDWYSIQNAKYADNLVSTGIPVSMYEYKTMTHLLPNQLNSLLLFYLRLR